MVGANGCAALLWPLAASSCIGREVSIRVTRAVLDRIRFTDP
jgi:hypothetical protein